VSHHLDTPQAAQSGQLYIDDLYVFSEGDSTVLMMDVNSNITEPNVKPGFHPEGRYEFKIHYDGAPVEALTYRVSFGEIDTNGRQPLALHALSGDEARDDEAGGELIVEGRTGQTSTNGDIRLWAGRVADPFYIDLSLLARVNSAIKNGSAVDLSGWNPADAHNSLEGATVETIVLAISHQTPALRPGTKIGVWCATKLATDAGGWRQINRAGQPMMWPIFYSDDTLFSDPVDTRHPSEDVKASAGYIAKQVGAVVAASGSSDDPQGYGQAVAKQLLPDVLSYIVGTPACYSFAGRNGRTLADNAPEVALSLVSGTAIPSGLKPAVSKHLREENFPYIRPA
jgi:hypothetical protein